MPLLSNLLALATIANAGRIVARTDTTISKSYTDSNDNTNFGASGVTTNVANDVLVWLNGGGTHNFYGNINNAGSMFVSQTYYLQNKGYIGGQSSYYIGHSTTDGNLNNTGTIQLNDYGSASAPTYGWYLRSHVNSGTIQWCGRGDTGGSTFQMVSDADTVNSGLISYEQSGNRNGASFYWRNYQLTTTTNPNNLYNNGAFRLLNTTLHGQQNIYGTGCWQIGQGGVLYLENGSGVYQNPNKGPTFPGQSIDFQHPSAILHLDPQAYSINSDFGPQLYGFATGHALEFSETIQSFTYTSSTGILAIKTTFYTANIKMGTGYTAGNFFKATNSENYGSYNAIFYNGAAPSQSVPGTCAITAPACQNLASNPPAAGSSSSSSSSSSIASSTSTSTSSKASTASASNTAVTSNTAQSSTAKSSSASSIAGSSSAASNTAQTSSASNTAQSSTTKTSTTSTVSSSTPSSTAITSPSLNYLGCFTDSIAARGINDFPRLVNAQSMTVELCQSYCSQFSGAVIFGIEYGQECYCGTQLYCPSVKTSEATCNTPCPGNSTETCGAGNALNVYGNFPANNPPSCASTSLSSVVTVATSTSSSIVTIATTTSSSIVTIATTTSKASTSSTASNAASASNTASNTVSASLTATSGSSIATNVPTNNSPSYSCAYSGCFTDSVSARALNDFPRYVNTTSMSVEVCQTYCSQFSAPFYGIEYGTECYCGVSLINNSIRAAEADCNFACPGNATEVCGAGDRLNVYGCSAVASATSTKTVATSSAVITSAPVASTCACTSAQTVTVTVTKTA